MRSTHDDTLDLAAIASDEQIQARFRALALAHHPDHNQGIPDAGQFRDSLNSLLWDLEDQMARGLERLSPASYIDFLCQAPGRLTRFPFTSVENYHFNIRLRMNRYLERMDRLPWPDKVPASRFAWWTPS